MISNIAILSWNSDRAMLEVVQELRQTMDGMIREIRQSNSILPSSPSTEFEFSIPDVNNKIKYSYDQNERQIIREHPPETKRVLANNINSLNFRPTDSRVLQIQIQATKTIRNAPRSFSLTEEVRLRNE